MAPESSDIEPKFFWWSYSSTMPSKTAINNAKVLESIIQDLDRPEANITFRAQHLLPSGDGFLPELRRWSGNFNGLFCCTDLGKLHRKVKLVKKLLGSCEVLCFVAFGICVICCASCGWDYSARIKRPGTQGD